MGDSFFHCGGLIFLMNLQLLTICQKRAKNMHATCFELNCLIVCSSETFEEDFTGTRKVIGKRFLKPVDSLVKLSEHQFLLSIRKNFKNFSFFVAFRFFKNQKNSVFGPQLVPNTSELKLTGSTNYTSTVTM